MVDSPENYYALLEVSPSATQEEIKKAYFAVAKKYHPDVYHGQDAQQRFQRINEAYETLKDPLKRAEYDGFLSFVNRFTQQSKKDPVEKTDKRDEESFTYRKSYWNPNEYKQDPVDEDHNFYTDLELELFADREKIRKAYKDLSEKYDPDISLVPNVREKLRKITIAFTILNNPEKKERYDCLLKLFIKYSTKKKNSQTASYSVDTNNSSSSATSSSKETTDSKEKQSFGTYSSSYSWKSDDTYIENKKATEDNPTVGCSQAFVLFISLFIIFVFFSECSRNNKPSPNRSSSGSSSYYQATNTVRKTATPTISKKPTGTAKSSKSFFDKHEITLQVGEEYHMRYSLPNDGQKYTYYYASKWIVDVASNQKSPELIIKAKSPGYTAIVLSNSKNIEIDRCNIRVIPNNVTTVPTLLSTNTVVSKSTQRENLTPTPVSLSTTSVSLTPTLGWVFMEHKINIKIGESMELHFMTPPYTSFSYTLDGSGIISAPYTNKSPITITGVRSGIGKIFLRNNKNEIVDTCTITVTESSVGRPLMPTPLPRKQGGYTEKELIENGHVGTQNKDGTMYYPGFYQAPNGNFFPTGN